MAANAYILDWTMNDYEVLKAELAEGKFRCENEGRDLRVHVPYARVADAARLFQQHLNAPYNYVDIQYPAARMTVIVFRERVFLIRNTDENRIAQEWGIGQGLPPEQADWGTSF